MRPPLASRTGPSWCDSPSHFEVSHGDEMLPLLTPTCFPSVQLKRIERLSEECVACLGRGTVAECVGSSACGLSTSQRLSTQSSDADLNIICGSATKFDDAVHPSHDFSLLNVIGSG